MALLDKVFRSPKPVTIQATTEDETANLLELKNLAGSTVYSVNNAGTSSVGGGGGAPIAESLIDAKGDIIVGSAPDVAARLAIGVNRSSLVADSTQVTGLKWVASSVFNVRDYGALGNDSANDYAAIMAAYAAIPAIGGALYFPSGSYIFGSALSFTNAKPLSILGDGPMASVLRPSFAGGNAITVNGTSRFSFGHIGLSTAINRLQGSYRLYVANCERVMIDSVYCVAANGGLFMFDTCNFLQMVNCQGDSNDNTNGDTCLRIKGGGGTVSNCYFRTGPYTGGYSNSKPCVHLTGQTTSLNISNSGFSGMGPHSKWSISGITSTGASFVVTTSAIHNFLAGDFVAIRGASVATYNNAWRIVSVTATTLTVTSILNPGTATATGTAESLAACVLVSNEDGAVNESRFSSVIFEAIQANLYGSVGLYFDGRRAAANPIQGWNVSGCYFDAGTIGMMLHGKAASNSNDPNVFGFTVANPKFESTARNIHIEQATGIVVQGAIGNSNQPPTTDRIAVDNAGDPRPFGIYIAAGDAAPYTQGVTISGSHLGVNANWAAVHEVRSHDNAIFIKGGANVHDLIVTGNTLYGRQFSVNNDTFGGRWKFADNILHSGSIGAEELPSIVSAASLNIWPFHDAQKVTGTTNITNISAGWQGKEIRLLFVSALSLTTGGNLAITANYAVLAGQIVTLVYDGTSWYLK